MRYYDVEQMKYFPEPEVAHQAARKFREDIDRISTDLLMEKFSVYESDLDHQMSPQQTKESVYEEEFQKLHRTIGSLESENESLREINSELTEQVKDLEKDQGKDTQETEKALAALNEAIEENVEFRKTISQLNAQVARLNQKVIEYQVSSKEHPLEWRSRLTDLMALNEEFVNYINSLPLSMTVGELISNIPSNLQRKLEHVRELVNKQGEL